MNRVVMRAEIDPNVLVICVDDGALARATDHVVSAMVDSGVSVRGAMAHHRFAVEYGHSRNGRNHASASILVSGSFQNLPSGIGRITNNQQFATRQFRNGENTPNILWALGPHTDAEVMSGIGPDEMRGVVATAATRIYFILGGVDKNSSALHQHAHACLSVEIPAGFAYFINPASQGRVSLARSGSREPGGEEISDYTSHNINMLHAVE